MPNHPDRTNGTDQAAPPLDDSEDIVMTEGDQSQKNRKREQTGTKKTANKKNGNETENVSATEMDPAEAVMRARFPRVTVKGWTRLGKISGRPSMRKLVRLRDEDLKALVRFNRIGTKSGWKKKDYLQCLRDWFAAHPDGQLEVPRLPKSSLHSHSSDASKDTDTQGKTDNQTRGRSPASSPPKSNGAPPQSGRNQPNAGQETGENAQRDRNGQPKNRGTTPGNLPDTRPGQWSIPQGAARDRDDLHPNSSGQRSRQTANAAALATQRAANALREVADGALALMDTLAGLVERAMRGETIKNSELAALRPAVNASRSAMQGMVAGFAANDLGAELQNARNSASTKSQRTEHGNGKRKTYAQAAHGAAAPSQ